MFGPAREAVALVLPLVLLWVATASSAARFMAAALTAGSGSRCRDGHLVRQHRRQAAAAQRPNQLPKPAHGARRRAVAKARARPLERPVQHLRPRPLVEGRQGAMVFR